MTAEEARGFFAFRPDRHRYDRRPDTRKPEMNRRNNLPENRPQLQEKSEPY